MAGKPGMKGGGGARPGAGRPPKEPETREADDLITDDPVKFLIGVMRDPTMPMKDRQDAAKAVLAYRVKMAGGDGGGKKGARKDAAEEAAGGRFAPQAPPRLHAVK